MFGAPPEVTPKVYVPPGGFGISWAVLPPCCVGTPWASKRQGARGTRILGCGVAVQGLGEFCVREWTLQVLMSCYQCELMDPYGLVEHRSFDGKLMVRKAESHDA